MGAVILLAGRGVGVRGCGAIKMSTETSQKVCSHCGGSEFYLERANFPADLRAVMPLPLFKSGECTVRVCGSCGLVQWFLTPQSLAGAKQKFEREGCGE